FADVSSVMTNAGLAHMGVGSAKGKDKAEMAAKMAMSSPLLETNITGAKGIVVNIEASPDIGLDEVDVATSLIQNEAHPDATFIFGMVSNPELEDEMKITVIATGFDVDKRSTEIKRYASPSTAKPTDTAAPAKDAAAPARGEQDIDAIIQMLNNNRGNS
ncbi:MAG TPA: cell division protein FtsZ, partial [Bacillota bacterium]|nr:cell division protein FtsZ [Bacillota bacterium]